MLIKHTATEVIFPALWISFSIRRSLSVTKPLMFNYFRLSEAQLAELLTTVHDSTLGRSLSRHPCEPHIVILLATAWSEDSRMQTAMWVKGYMVLRGCTEEAGVRPTPNFQEPLFQNRLALGAGPYCCQIWCPVFEPKTTLLQWHMPAFCLHRG